MKITITPIVSNIEVTENRIIIYTTGTFSTGGGGGGGGGGFQTLTDGSSVAWDVDDGYTAFWQLAANRSFPTVSNHSAGDMLYLYVKKTAGTEVLSFTGIMGSGAVTPVLSTTANAIDILTFNVVDIGGTLYLNLLNINPDVQIIT